MQDLDALWDFQDPQGSRQRFESALRSESSPEIQAEIHTQVARTLGLEGKFAQAESELRAAQALLPETPCRASVRLELELGRVLNSSGNPTSAIPHFKRAAELSEEVGEAGLLIDAIHMLAIADSDNGLEWNLKGISMASESSDPRARRWLASLHNNTGWSLFDAGRLQESLDHFEKAVPLREAMGNKANLHSARWCVGRVLRELGRGSEALSLMRELLDSDPTDAHVHQELAILLHADGEPSEAALHAQRALEVLGDDPWMQSNRPELLAQLRRIAGPTGS